MGQDREDRQGGDAGLTKDTFGKEIRAAVRYEKGLVIKALIALALVALVVLARLLYLA